LASTPILRVDHVFLARKDNAQVLDGFLDIVADLDIAIHDDSVWRQRFWQDYVARAISPSNIEPATPSRWLGSAAVAIETNRWRSVFVIVTSGSEFKLDASRRSFDTVELRISSTEL
jgi:hypothetical protein